MSDKEERVQVLVRVTRAQRKAIRLMALDLGMTVQEMASAALADMLAAYAARKARS